MKGDAITMVLLLVVTVSLTAIIVGWSLMNMSGFFEMNEINAVKQEFSECNDKLFETARTGLSNNCIFSINKGQIAGTSDDLIYQIASSEKVCDSSDWVFINPEKNIWQRCGISGRQSVFSLKWNYTSIKFQFQDMGNVQVTGQSGKNLEVSRASIEDSIIVLGLNIR